MREQFFAWSAFFVCYAYVAFELMVWLARVKIATSKGSRVSPAVRCLAFLAVFGLAALPPLLEPVSRVSLGWPSLSNGAFALFMLCWFVAALPGIVASRRTFRAAGLSPDE